MTREREIEQAKKWRQTNWYDSVPPLLDEALAAYGQEKFEAGERLGREREREECASEVEMLHQVHLPDRIPDCAGLIRARGVAKVNR